MQTRLEKPTMMPDANIENPTLITFDEMMFVDGTLSSFVCRMIATITPYMAIDS